MATVKPLTQVSVASAAVFVVAAATILAALAFEHLGGYVPCPICLQQRYAYYFAVPASAVAFVLAQSYPAGWARTLLALIAVAFLVNAGLGVYHAGIEWKWWPGPDTCATETAIEWGAGGLAQQLETVRVVACDEAPWRFLGLSFAGWNVVVSAFLAGIAAWGAAPKR
ncbi:MAG: disulfide bond formation protein B [Methyloceanibacter sp.]